MINYLDFGEAWHYLPSGPNAIAAAYGYRENWDIGFDCEAYRARFESAQFPVGMTAGAFGENYRGPTLIQPLKRSSNGRRIAPFQLQRPGAKHTEDRANQRPA